MPSQKAPDKTLQQFLTVVTHLPTATILLSEILASRRSRFPVLQHSGRMQCLVHCNSDNCQTFSSRPWRSHSHFYTVETRPCSVLSADLHITIFSENKNILIHYFKKFTVLIFLNNCVRHHSVLRKLGVQHREQTC